MGENCARNSGDWTSFDDAHRNVPSVVLPARHADARSAEPKKTCTESGRVTPHVALRHVNIDWWVR